MVYMSDLPNILSLVRRLKTESVYLYHYNILTLYIFNSEISDVL